MFAQSWLSKNGIKAKNLEVFDYLMDSAFRHMSSKNRESKVCNHYNIINSSKFSCSQVTLCPMPNIVRNLSTFHGMMDHLFMYNYQKGNLKTMNQK